MLNFVFSGKGLELNSPLYFVQNFHRKNIFHFIFYWLTEFFWLIAFAFWDIAHMCIVIISFPADGIIDFAIDFSSLIKLFSYITKKFWTKIKYLRTKKLLRWYRKHFSSSLNGFQLLKIHLQNRRNMTARGGTCLTNNFQLRYNAIFSFW